MLVVGQQHTRRVLPGRHQCAYVGVADSHDWVCLVLSRFVVP